MSFWQSVKSMGKMTFGSNQYEGKNKWNQSMGKFTDLSAVDIDGKEMSLNVFNNKVLLITNVACRCGYTKSSYDKMQELSITYHAKGLRILCFPCNQFMSQEPWSEKEIKEWVTGRWDKLNPVLFSKIEVNGDNTHKVYTFLKSAFPGDINWNFATKFVIGGDGIPVQRFDKNQSWDDIEQCIVKELEKLSLETQENDVQKEEKKENKEDKEQVDDVKKEDKDEDKRMLSTRDYVFKSMDKEQKTMTCLDDEFNDKRFDLDMENEELMAKIEKLVEDGNNKKTDVMICVATREVETKAVHTITDVKLDESWNV